jgi:hypothetical protein
MNETASSNDSKLQRVRKTPLVVEANQIKVEELWLDKDILATRFDNRYIAEKVKRSIDGNPLIVKYLEGPLPDEIIQAQESEAAESQVSKSTVDRRGPNYDKLKEIQRVMQLKRDSAHSQKLA